MNDTVKAEQDLVTIQIDGESVAVPKGSMIIEASDRIGKPIPRFCYHKKLTVAANCRMCLVEVEKSGKPLPACATPVMDGMKVFTQSEKALRSQRNVMEFLLINHPLDCPICDQGGECELQDVAMGYGRSVSRFVERKRVVADEDLGSLIATDMTRCIHCTRCVRFMSEIAGTTELGGMGRGEHMEIGTWVGKAIHSEIGGNIIDVCPVGALTNKVFRFKARAWELIARASVGYHDALQSNLFLHTRRGEVLRTVPRENESINETWLSDRDRYSHQGLYADDRLLTPMLRDGERWREADWDEALNAAAQMLRDAGQGQTGFLVGPSTSCEEGSLLARLAKHLGSGHIDHRLAQADFADDGTAASQAGFQMPLAQIEQADVVILVGCDPRSEAPLLAHRIRKASRRGGKVYALNCFDFDFTTPLAGLALAAPSRLPATLAAFAAAVIEESGGKAPEALASLLASVQPDDGDRAAAKTLAAAGKAVVIVGQQAERAANGASLRALAKLIAQASGASYNVLPSGANPVGLARAGVLPAAGGHVAGQLANPRPAYVLYNAEVLDFAEPAQASKALSGARTIAFSAYADDALRQVADIILPIGLLPEIDATLVNIDGLTQVVAAGARLPGRARPGWRALRALADLLTVPELAFTDIDGLREHLALAPAAAADELKASAGDKAEAGGNGSNGAGATLERLSLLPIYRLDAVVRRAQALQESPLAVAPVAGLHPEQAAGLGLKASQQVRVSAGNGVAIELPVQLDERVPVGAVMIPAGFQATAGLPASGGLRIEGMAS
ncbi:MAG: NADH-quinone oxidoreductase subunit NuoG [Xanthomonadales bacterium]|nr:NADH-quinone oxidoreductase subunit NuoG [Xanthomonadales bacterium]